MSQWSSEQAAVAALVEAFPDAHVMAYRDTDDGREWHAPMSTATDHAKLIHHLRHMHGEQAATWPAMAARRHAELHRPGAPAPVPHDHR